VGLVAIYDPPCNDRGEVAGGEGDRCGGGYALLNREGWGG